ncbi:DUF790 family protein [Thermococcus barophilus]|uniref:Uncharacterized protein n=1 Tax=Thermococcus barophilus TaxID=55802 RepID=A0A0S1X873_THEBA|nr:DUF790 family protein [Thermococcus barophilus]ALM73998.1 hypothetical protein TBCH5v1_0017 [Thermococcus barophilus]
MLPKELLDARKSRGRIYLKFTDESHLKLAKAVIVAFKSSVGQSYAELQEKLKHLETAKNYRKVRGFAKIIERECVFEVPTKLNPIEVRRFLFERGYVTSEFERLNVLQEAAKHFGVPIEDIDRAMFADRDEEKVLKAVPNIEPEELIKRYNLSLLQTLMFNALRMSFKVSSNYQAIFRKIKWLGLMYELYEDSVDITGPASVLKLTRKYGTSMAKIIPEIVKAKEWWIRGEILDDYTKRVHIFELSSSDNILLPKIEEDIEYDSSLERQFSAKIKFLLGAEVVREPGILKAGKYAYIPDFLVRKNGKEIYVEIAGFWTEEYLKSKLEKISKLNLPMLVIVNDELLAGKLKRIQGKNVVLMRKGKIPYKEVMAKLKEMLS